VVRYGTFCKTLAITRYRAIGVRWTGALSKRSRKVYLDVKRRSAAFCASVLTAALAAVGYMPLSTRERWFQAISGSGGYGHRDAKGTMRHHQRQI